MLGIYQNVNHLHSNICFSIPHYYSIIYECVLKCVCVRLIVHLLTVIVWSTLHGSIRWGEQASQALTILLQGNTPISQFLKQFTPLSSRHIISQCLFSSSKEVTFLFQFPSFLSASYEFNVHTTGNHSLSQKALLRNSPRCLICSPGFLNLMTSYWNTRFS